MPHYNLPHNHGQNMERVLNKMPHTEDFTDIAFLFQQLGDPTRLRILWLLCHCDECVCNIAAAVDMSAPAVSHHLRILKKSGIISSRRDGKEVYYSLADTPQAKLLHRSIDAFYYALTVTSGSIFLISAFASARTASNLSSGASRTIFWPRKLTDTLVTPSIFFTAFWILSAQ